MRKKVDKESAAFDLNHEDRVGSLLRDADPVRDEPALSDVEAQLIRRAAVAAARQSPAPTVWRRPVWAAAAVAVAIAMAIGLAEWRPRTLAPTEQDGSTEGGRPTQQGPDAIVGVPAVRQQLQFATPGGTRVIWVFDSKFQP